MESGGYSEAYIENLLERVLDEKIEKIVSNKVVNIYKTQAEVIRQDNDGMYWVKLPGQQDITPLLGTSTEMYVGDIVNVEIRDGRTYATGNITSPAPTVASSQEFVQKVVDPITESISELAANTITVNLLKAKVAEIEDLTAVKADIDLANVGVANIGQAFIDTLVSRAGMFTNLKVEGQAIINDITAYLATVQQLNATNTNVQNLTAGKADIDFGNIDVAIIGQEVVDLLVGKAAMFDSIRATDGKVTNLETHFADIDLANVAALAARDINAIRANITSLMAASAYIERLDAGQGTFTDYLTGVTILGDLIKANTIVADRIVYPGSDGIYYMLNYHGGYTQVISTMEMNPSLLGYYEFDEDSGTYSLTEDTVAYSYVEVIPPVGGNPSALGYYEFDGTDYTLTEDTEVVSEKVYYTRELIKKYFAKTDDDLPLDQLQYQSALDGSRIVANSITANEINVENLTATGNVFMNNLQTRLLESETVRIGSNNGMHILVTTSGTEAEMGFYNGNDTKYVEVTPTAGSNPSALGYFEKVGSGDTYVRTQDTTVVSGKKYYNQTRNTAARVAFIDGNKLMIPYSVVLNQMMLGDWAWTFRKNGNMDLVYVGSE